MPYTKTMILGAMTGALIGTAWLTAFAGEPGKTSGLAMPGWDECRDAGRIGCAVGGDDTLDWDAWRYELHTAFRWTGRALTYSQHEPVAGLWLDHELPGYWYADCEDYALTMRRKMIEWGAPPDALRPIILFNGSGLHAVLSVWTHDAGVKIFDMNELYRCGLYDCPPPKVWDLREYVAQEGYALIFIYEPDTGTWRDATELGRAE